MTHGFLFDLDGVIIDSESEYTRIWSDIDRHFPTGVANFPIVIKGQTLTEILNRYYPRNQHAAITDMLNTLEQQMKYNYLPGAREMLLELKSREIPSVLVTSSNEMKMRRLREELPELEGLFTDIVTADRICHSKPDPEGFLLGARLCNARPRDCVVFEDSLQGVTAGHRAGCYVVGLSTTLPAEQLRPMADRIVETLSQITIDEVIEAIENKNKEP